jgi:hypothetical protein
MGSFVVRQGIVPPTGQGVHLMAFPERQSGFCIQRVEAALDGEQHDRRSQKNPRSEY